MSKYIGSWEISTGSLCNILAQAVDAGEIEPTDIVWSGPSGDAVVAKSAYDVEEEYGEYVDGGQVSEYLTDADEL